MGDSAMSNWHQTTGGFIKTKLYGVYVIHYLPYFFFFLHLKNVLNRNRTPSCSEVTDICWKSLWFSLLCKEGIQKLTQWLMYHECDKGIQEPTQCLMYHDCDRGIQRTAQRYHTNNDFNIPVSWNVVLSY